MGAFVYGTSFNDNIYNSGTLAKIFAGFGNDMINNSGGSVNINGDDGDDTVYNHGSFSKIYGGYGNDVLYNYGRSSDVYGGYGNDQITNQNNDYSKIYGDDGDDTISNNSRVTIYGGSGSDIVYHDNDYSYIDGGYGDDKIYINGYGSGNTVCGGEDNNVINGNGKAQIYRCGFGNDTIYSVGDDSIIKTSSSSYSTMTSGSDIVINIGSYAVTLKDAVGKKINIDGSTDDPSSGDEFPTVGGNGTDDGTVGTTPVSVEGSTSNQILRGSTGNDTINNITAMSAQIYAGLGNDEILNAGGSFSTIYAGSGDDKITNVIRGWTDNNYSLIYAGAGDDYIRDTGLATTICGGDGNDTVHLQSASNAMINLGSGYNVVTLTGGSYCANNTIIGGEGYNSVYTEDGESKKVYAYSGGNGSDTIYGATENDTIKIVNVEYTRENVGNNVVLKFDNETVTFIDAANKNLNIEGTPYVEPVWTINGTTATYGNSNRTLATITGLKSKVTVADFSLSGNVITLKSSALGTSKVSLTGDYTLALSGVSSPKNTKARFVVNGTTAKYLSKGISAGYTLSKDKKSVSYTKASGGKTLISLSGLKSGTKASNLTLKNKTVTLSKNAIGKNLISVKADGYKFILQSSGKLKNVGKTTILQGSSGKDTLIGGSGKDTLLGGNGNDSLTGGKGNDNLNGGNGVDTLVGGADNDTLTGGKGKDIFVYAKGDGKDIITDYTARQDKIKISSGSISKTKVSGKDVIFTVGSGSITVKNGKDQKISVVDSKGKTTTKTYNKNVTANVSDLWFAEENNFVTSDNISEITKNYSTPTALEKISTTNFENLVQENNFVTYSEK
ncbi:MAG: hypothetical protein IK062_11625 [Selenomonadaceae bacterium]|nr:hypothetical protein [Selenomonadaceae bacterium]